MQFDVRTPGTLHVRTSTVNKEQFILKLYQGGREPVLTLGSTSIKSAREFLDAVKTIGGEVEDPGAVDGITGAIKNIGIL